MNSLENFPGFFVCDNVPLHPEPIEGNSHPEPVEGNSHPEPVEGYFIYNVTTEFIRRKLI